MGICSQQREVQELLHTYGYNLVRQRKHRIYKHTTGHIFVAPSTPSDTRSWNNSLAQLKKVVNFGLANGILHPPTKREPISDQVEQISTKVLKAPSPIVSSIALPEMKGQTLHTKPISRRKKHVHLPNLIGIHRINEIMFNGISPMFTQYKFSERDFAAEPNEDKREYLQSLGEDFNRKLDRATRSAADRLTNVVKDTRKNRRIKKSRARSQLYEKFRAIFGEDTLLEALLLERPEYATHRFVLNLVEICTSMWGVARYLSTYQERTKQAA